MSAEAIRPLDHAEVDELAGLYVLHALEPHELEQVRAHLATCSEPHAIFAEVGGVVPALATQVERVDAPATLKGRVMAAVEADAVPVASSEPVEAPRRQAAAWDLAALGRSPGRPAWRSISVWATGLAAVLVIAVLGTWTMVLQSRADRAEQRAALVSQALALVGEPETEVVTLTGTDAAPRASGFVVLPADGDGYIVLVGLPPAPDGVTYQAWYLADGRPTSAGLIDVGDDGYAILGGVRRQAAMDTVALTAEPAGGVPAPTGDVVAAGEVTA